MSSSTTKHCPERDASASPRKPLPPPSLGQEVRRTFGVFGLLLFEARVQLARVIVETSERLMEDPVLGLGGRVDAAHGGVDLVVRDASPHVPEVSGGHGYHQTLLEAAAGHMTSVKPAVLTEEWSQTPAA